MAQKVFCAPLASLALSLLIPAASAQNMAGQSRGAAAPTLGMPAFSASLEQPLGLSSLRPVRLGLTGLDLPDRVPSPMPSARPQVSGPALNASPAGLPQTLVPQLRPRQVSPADPASLTRPSPLRQPHASAQPALSRGERSISQLGQQVAQSAADLSRLPRLAAPEKAWQLGRKVWDSFSGERAIGGGAAAGGQGKANVPALPISAIPAGLGGAISARLIEGRAADAIAAVSAVHFAPVPDIMIDGGVGVSDAPGEGRRFSRGAAASQAIIEQGQRVALLALRVVGQTVELSEGQSAQILTLEILSAHRLPARARRAQAVEDLRDAIAQPMPSLAADLASAGETELWNALTVAPHLDAAAAASSPRLSRRIPAPKLRQALGSAALPWMLLLPLTLLALRQVARD